MTDATDTLVRVIPKNAAEELRISLTEYNGHSLVDLRTYVEYRTTAKIGPTKKGVTFAVALLPEIVAGLQEAEAEARRLGLI